MKYSHGFQLMIKRRMYLKKNLTGDKVQDVTIKLHDELYF